MAGLGGLVVSLSANIANFESAMNRANYVANQNSKQIVRSLQGVQSSFDSIPGSILRITAAIGGLAGIGLAFKKGIDAADEFRVSTIGIAAALTNISKPGQGSFEQMFKQNLVHAKAMYEAIEAEAAKHFAGPQDMMKAYNQLVQQGYNVRMEEVGALGTLTDKIKLATAGQNQEVQINQEIRALMEGQANAHSAIARELQTRLGPAWKEIVQQHKEAGDLLNYLSSLWPGLEAATKEVQDTLTSQKTTLMGHLAYLGREGLGGAYEDIVGFMKDINAYLKDHGRELADNIVGAWNAVKEVAGGVVSVVSEIAGWIKTAWGYTEGLRNSLSEIAKQRSDMGVGMGLDVMPGIEGAAASQEAVIAEKMRQNERLAKAAADFKKSAYQSYLKDLGPTKTTMPAHDTGAGGKGGGKSGAEAAADRIQTIIDTLNKEIAKLSQGSIAEIDAWAKKTIDDIEKVGRKGAETQEALALVSKATALKKQKVEEEFNIFVGKESGNAYVELEAQARAWLIKYKGIKGAEESINNITARKRWEIDVKNMQDLMGLYKNYYDTVSSLTPNLSEQNTLKKKALDLEIEINRYALERKLLEMNITGAQADELRGMQALAAQAQKFNLAMESDKGLKGWAFGRVKAENQKNTWADAMEGLEGYVTDAFGQGIQGALTKTKLDFMELAKTMAQSFALNLGKQAIHWGFTEVAKGILGEKAGGLLGQRGSSPANPVYVSMTSMSKMGGDLAETFGSFLDGFSFETDDLLSVFDEGTGFLNNSSTLFGDMFSTSIEGLFGASDMFGSVFNGFLSALPGILGGGGGGGGGIFGSILGGAVEVIGGFLGFLHGGGIVKAHRGWPGLASDEVPIIAQTGERVLSRRQNREYEAGRSIGQPIIFSPTYHINAIDSRGIKAVLTENAKHIKAELKKIAGNEYRG